MKYYEDTGDIGGIEIFVLYSRQGYYALVQFAEGSPDDPILVKATISGSAIDFDLPMGEERQERFHGTFTAKGLIGRFESGLPDPTSLKSTFLLKRTRSYWQH
jgi:hypothetical protein